jgi:hypothetical protein
MSGLVPNRFLFDLEFPLVYREEPPVLDGTLEGWTDREWLPCLDEIDDASAEPFGDLYVCWNESGLYIACLVEEKLRRLRCDPKHFASGDNLRLCLDMRDTRTLKRASRFCQQFYFLPTGGGPSGKEPVAGSSRIRSAREDAPVVASDRIPIASSVSRHAYILEAHLPAEVLSGFDPEEHPRIGFYYILEDDDHGQQCLTVGDDLNWFLDPSTWATAVLTR